jgi:UDP-2-acetamido-3-amino-2,3-dideoxy-glucuronate N-acetyltransferase
VHVHPTAVIDEDVVLGAETHVWHFVHISAGARIGRGCSLGQNVFVGRGVSLGNGVRVQNNVSIYEGVEIDDDVFLGPSCVFTNVRNPRANVSRKHSYSRTRVRRGVTIGANATVVCGVTLGEYSFIGAGTVVTHDVPAHALLVGNPGRQRGWMCRCGERLPDAAELSCGSCAVRYRIRDGACEAL